MGMLVASDDGFFSEEKRHTEHRVSMLAPGVPAYALSNTCSAGRYRIDKEVLTDPLRETLLQHTRFTALRGPLSSYRLYLLLSPHIGNRGLGNTGWVGDYKGVGMLFAERDGTCMALACSVPWLNRSVGFVGSSDGWQDVSGNRRMTWSWERAENGNIALTAEVDIVSAQGDFVVALGFGRNAAEAGNRALASLSDGFEPAQASLRGGVDAVAGGPCMARAFVAQKNAGPAAARANPGPARRGPLSRQHGGYPRP